LTNKQQKASLKLYELIFCWDFVESGFAEWQYQKSERDRKLQLGVKDKSAMIPLFFIFPGKKGSGDFAFQAWEA